MTSIIRKPEQNEANDCIRLIYISGPELYSFIFASREPEVYQFIRLLYDTPGNSYSSENAFINVEDGTVTGLILSYPARNMVNMSIHMFRCIPGMLKTGGVLKFIKIMSRMSLNRYFPGTADDELFISNLAVSERYRGRGTGTGLLAKAEELAVESGLGKLSLYVETDNSNAKNVYERFGFREVRKSVLPAGYHKYNLFGFYKMVKDIGPTRKEHRAAIDES